MKKTWTRKINKLKRKVTSGEFRELNKKSRDLMFLYFKTYREWPSEEHRRQSLAELLEHFVENKKRVTEDKINTARVMMKEIRDSVAFRFMSGKKFKVNYRTSIATISPDELSDLFTKVENVNKALKELDYTKESESWEKKIMSSIIQAGG